MAQEQGNGNAAEPSEGAPAAAQRSAEEGGAPVDQTRPGIGAERQIHQAPQEQREPPARGRPPSPDPDVIVDVPKLRIEELRLDIENLDAHISLRARLANLLQLDVGIQARLGKINLDLKGVETQALLKVRLERLHEILDRALSTIDRNPQILHTVLDTAGSAVRDVGQTAQQALGPQGAVTHAVDQGGRVAQQAMGPGGAASQAVNQVAGAAQQAGGAQQAGAAQGGAGSGSGPQAENRPAGAPADGGANPGRTAWQLIDTLVRHPPALGLIERGRRELTNLGNQQKLRDLARRLTGQQGQQR